MRFALAFLLGAATALALYYHLPRQAARILTANPPATPPDWQPKHITYRNGVRTS